MARVVARCDPQSDDGRGITFEKPLVSVCSEISNTTIRGIDQRAILKLDRGADIEYADTILTERQPISADAEKPPAHLRPYHFTVRYIYVDANAFGKWADDLWRRKCHPIRADVFELNVVVEL